MNHALGWHIKDGTVFVFCGTVGLDGHAAIDLIMYGASILKGEPANAPSWMVYRLAEWKMHQWLQRKRPARPKVIRLR